MYLRRSREGTLHRGAESKKPHDYLTISISGPVFRAALRKVRCDPGGAPITRMS